VLSTLWTGLDAALRDQLAASNTSLQEFLKARHPVWNLVGRVHFNLAENLPIGEIGGLFFLCSGTT
jgi:hypothetical protein